MAENIARTDSGQAGPCGGNGWRPANEASLAPPIAGCMLTGVLKSTRADQRQATSVSRERALWITCSLADDGCVVDF